MRLTEAGLAELVARGATIVGTKAAPKAKPSHVPGVMNKTEAAWATRLEARRLAGEIRRWRFEAVTLVLAPKLEGGKAMRYTPDFLVWEADGSLTFEETKGGFAREDAMCKLRTAAVLYPEFRFRLVRRIKTQWLVEEVHA